MKVFIIKIPAKDDDLNPGDIISAIMDGLGFPYGLVIEAAELPESEISKLGGLSWTREELPNK